jgi:histidinol-phosphate phosphatase family protein
MPRSAVFIDFQGTLGGSGIDDITTLEFYPFSIEAVKKLNDNGLLAIGLTNQSRIAKGALSWQDYEAKLAVLNGELNAHDAYFDAVYCCPHTRADHCLCKKPKAGMIDSAKKDFDIDTEKSYVIGDMGKNDMVLARHIGAKGILVLTGAGKGSMGEFRHTWAKIEPDFIADTVLDAVDFILSDIRA